MERVRGFDGLRALAAASVVFTHLGLYGAFAGTPLFSMFEGFQAVQLFFALSGFLITALLIRERQALGRISIGRFYARRAFRIFPLYFFCLAATAVLSASFGSLTSAQERWYALFYGYNFMPRHLWSDQLTHTWSLAVEEHFYLLWPVAFACFYPARKRLLFLGGLLACALAVYGRMHIGSWWRANYVVAHWTCFAGFSILAGCLVAIVCCDEDFRPRALRFFSSRGALILALGLWANGFLPWLHGTIPSFYLSGAGFAVLVGWVYANQRSRTVRALEIAPLRFLGRISYGIYMYQGLLITTGPERSPGRAWPLDPWVGLLLLSLIAPLSYYALERPLLRVGRRFRPRYVAAVPTQAPSASVDYDLMKRPPEARHS